MLTKLQHDGITELVNIGVGKASLVLSKMLHKEVKMYMPVVEMQTSADFIVEMKKMNEEWAYTNMSFNGDLEGIAGLIIQKQGVESIVAKLTGEKEGSRDIALVINSVISEVANITLNGVMGVIANILKIQLNYTVPYFMFCKTEEYAKSLEIPPNSFALFCKTRMSVDDLSFSSNILLLIKNESISALANNIDKMLVKE